MSVEGLQMLKQREKKISKNLLKDHFKQEKLKVLLKHPQYKIKFVQIIILGVRSQCELNFYIERNSLNIFFSKTIWSEKLNTVLKNLSLVQFSSVSTSWYTAVEWFHYGQLKILLGRNGEKSLKIFSKTIQPEQLKLMCEHLQVVQFHICLNHDLQWQVGATLRGMEVLHRNKLRKIFKYILLTWPETLKVC